MSRETAPTKKQLIQFIQKHYPPTVPPPTGAVQALIEVLNPPSKRKKSLS